MILVSLIEEDEEKEDETEEMDEDENEEDEDEEEDDDETDEDDESDENDDDDDDSDEDDKKIRPWNVLMNITSENMQERFNEAVEKNFGRKIQAQTFKKLKR